MPKTWEEIPVAEFDAIVVSLGESLKKLTEVSHALNSNKHKTLWCPWSKETLRFASGIASLAREVFADVDDQVLSKKLNRPCRAQVEKERAAREIARRKRSEATQAAPPVKKPRGRPRKST
jgi:hypothetical protein